MYNSNRGSSSNHYDSKYDNNRNYKRAGAAADEDDVYEKRRSRKNRWDDNDTRMTNNNGDNNSSRYKRERSRSRSPPTTKDSSLKIRSDIYEKDNKIQKRPSHQVHHSSSNWSDSSSDEERKSRRNDRRDRERDSHSYSSRDNSSQLDVGTSSKCVNGNGRNPYQFQEPLVLENSVLNESQSQESSDLVLSGSSFVQPKTSAGIKMRLLSQPVKSSPIAATSTKPKQSMKVASVFNIDDDSDDEEMPAECKMRMKNVGRETPTSAGPNSFGKTKLGFCNMATIKERRLQEELLKKK